MLKTSEQIDKISEALAMAQGEIETLSFNAKNPHFNNKFANLAETREKSKESLSRNGLAIIQAPFFAESRVCVTTRLNHKSGQWFESTLSMKPTQDIPQAIGSAITYAKRYGMQAMLGLVGDEDDDGNEASMLVPKQMPKKSVHNIFSGSENDLSTLVGILSKNNISLDPLKVAKELVGKEFIADNVKIAVQIVKKQEVLAELYNSAKSTAEEHQALDNQIPF